MGESSHRLASIDKPQGRPSDAVHARAATPRLTRWLVNLKTAKALNLTVPPPLLQRADQVIE
jgi:hypothetical protein